MGGTRTLFQTSFKFGTEFLTLIKISFGKLGRIRSLPKVVTGWLIFETHCIFCMGGTRSLGPISFMRLLHDTSYVWSWYVRVDWWFQKDDTSISVIHSVFFYYFFVKPYFLFRLLKIVYKMIVFFKTIIAINHRKNQTNFDFLAWLIVIWNSYKCDTYISLKK